MHPVCVQVHRLGSRPRSPPLGTQRGGKAEGRGGGGVGGGRLCLPRPSSLSSAPQAGTEAAPPRGGRCRDAGSAGPQGPLGPAASPLPSPPPPRPPPPPRKSDRLGAAQRLPAAGDAGRGGQRAVQVPRGGPREGGERSSAPWERPRAPSHPRRGAAVAARMPAPPREVRPRRRPTSQKPWERSPPRLAKRKGLTPDARGGAGPRLPTLRRAGEPAGLRRRTVPPSPSPVAASQAACGSRARRRPKREPSSRRPLANYSA